MTKALILEKAPRILVGIALWAVTVWLLYPLMVLDSINMASAKSYLYRSAIGIAIMIILFGKTVFDLFLPLGGSTKKNIGYALFLVAYAMLIAGGIIFMVARLVALYIQNQAPDIQF